MADLVLWGASGHGKVVLEFRVSARQWDMLAQEILRNFGAKQS